MARFIKLEICDLPDLIVIGKELVSTMDEQANGNNPFPAFWDRCFKDDTFPLLEQQSEYVYDDAYVGFMTNWQNESKSFSYIIGMLMKTGASIPDGYVSIPIPASKVGIGWIKGRDASDTCSLAHEFTEKAIRDRGYNCSDMKWCMELYNCPRFTTPDENGEIILDYYIPV